MKKSRQETLGETGIFHKYWKGHNGESVFDTPLQKSVYLQSLCITKSKEICDNVKWHSYCIMTNHPHEVGSAGWDKSVQDSVKTGITHLGNWMRNGHSRFGAWYNKFKNRYGKVGSSRPKTSQIKSEADVLNTMLYCDANPVRAGIVSHPSKYFFSTYRLYAYGEKNLFSKYIDPPTAYLNLGKTPKERQYRYRRLMTYYLRNNDLLQDIPAADKNDKSEELNIYLRIFDAIQSEFIAASAKNRSG